MPKISIIIPIYNVEKYLKQCLDSIVNQTLRDIEIICVNDGSTDASLSILEQYAKNDNRIKIISKPNAGYGHTINVGFDNASGEYIGIVEADDFAHLDMFETLYNVGQKTSAEIIKANYIDYYSDSIYPQVADSFPEPLYDMLINPAEYNYLLSRFFHCVWSAIYKRSFLQENNIRFNETPGASYQDTSFYFKVYAHAQSLYFVNKPLINYRRDNNTASVKNSGKVFCVFDECKVIDDFILSHPEKKEFWIIRNYMRFRNYKFHYHRVAREYKAAFLKRFSQEFQYLRDNNYLPLELFSKKELRNVNLIADHYLIFHIKSQMYIFCRNILESILSVKNEREFKVITIIGFKYKFLRSKFKNSHK